MVPAERRPNRKQRRRSKAIALRANGIPIASASARRVAGLAGKLHEGLAENAKNALLAYQARLGKCSRAGLEVCGFDKDLGMMVVVFKSDSRMQPEEVMQVLKSTMSEHKSNLSHRSSIGLGIANLSFVIRLDSSKGPIIALVCRNAFSHELALASYAIEIGHNVVSVGWNQGCEASTFPTKESLLGQLNDAKAMKSGGLMATNVRKVLSIGGNSLIKPKVPRILYKNSNGDVISRPLANHIDRHKWADKGKYSMAKTIQTFANNQASLVDQYFHRVQQMYIKYVPIYLESRGWAKEAVHNSLESIAASLLTTTLKVSNYKQIGIHRDPPTPMFAAVCGHTNYIVKDGDFVRTSNGGNLFLADGMIRLDYSPRDLILFDGNFAHGISNISNPSGIGQKIERFSIITFSRWGKEKMKKAGNYTGFGKYLHK